MSHGDLDILKEHAGEFTKCQLFVYTTYLINYQFLIDEKDSHSNGDLPDLNDPELEIAASKIQSFWKRKKSNEPTGRFCYKQNNLFHLFSYLFFHPEYFHYFRNKQWKWKIISQIGFWDLNPTEKLKD